MTAPARRVLYAAVATVALLVVWFAVWSPRSAAIERSEERIVSATGQQARLRSALALATEWEQRGDQGARALEMARTALPEDDDLAAFVLFVDAAARTAGCTTRQLSPRPPGDAVPAPAGTTAIAVDLTVGGSLDGAQSFLDELSRLARVVVVDEVQIGQSGEGQVEMTLALRIFRAR